MENIVLYLQNLKNIIWGTPLLTFILGTGIYLTILLRGMQFRYLWYALKQVVSGQKKNAQGDINPFEALMTSLAGAIGTGNIVGVATGVAIGGLGSLFWMTVTALVSMATKYAESLLAVKYRTIDDKGEMIGGPMQYIERGIGWKWLAYLFAGLGALAAFGTGNLIQVNSIAEATGHISNISHFWIGILTAIAVGLVVIGGVKSIGHFAGVIVPIMALFYLISGAIVIFLHLDQLPSAIALIFTSAFSGQAAAGGFAGASVMMAVQMGVSRSVLSNEAGLGISAIAAAAAQTDAPGRQAMITMTGALMSTVVVCSFTGIVLAVTQVMYQTDATGEVLNGAGMAIEAFSGSFTGGLYVIAIGLILFAYTTVVAWAYYGEKCFEFLFGTRYAFLYRVIFTLAVIPGATLKLQTVWLVADIFNGLMVIPNLIALIALSSVISLETKSFLEIADHEIATGTG